MTGQEQATVLKNCAFMLKDGTRYMKKEHEKQFREAYEEAIKALSEPTIPLSVIENIHDAIDNADCDARLEDESGSFTEEVFTKEHVHEIIDKVVKECTHETN